MEMQQVEVPKNQDAHVIHYNLRTNQPVDEINKKETQCMDEEKEKRSIALPPIQERNEASMEFRLPSYQDLCASVKLAP